MLVNFRVENFLSFEELALFSMVSGDSPKHPNHLIKYKDVSLLKFAALYGANAAGKSNLVKAIKLSQQLITKGLTDMVTYDKYCKVNKGNKEKDTSFEYEIALNDCIYAYGFSLNLFEKVIKKEWLYLLAGDNEIEIFSREYKGNENVVNVNYNDLKLNEEVSNIFRVYIHDFRDKFDQLFLKELSGKSLDLETNEHLKIFSQLYRWFSNTLEVISPDESTSDSASIYLKKEKSIELAQFLNNFGTGIQEVCKVKVHEKELFKEMPAMIVKKIIGDFIKINNKKGESAGLVKSRENIYELKFVGNEVEILNITFKHEVEDATYTLGEESDGTARLVELYDILATESEKVFVVDEIDRSLHPNLTYNFINGYLNKKEIGQLIVTTHEDRLLDLKMLRRDEIWFVEKQDDGTTGLYSLEGYEKGFDDDILRAYLDGRYGGVPEFKFLK